MEVLLFETIPERGGFWQPVTGGVEPTETVEAAARRELREETGFVAPSLASLDPLGDFEFEARGNHYVENVYSFQTDAGREPKLDPREHRAFKWVDACEAIALLKWPSNARMLERLLRLKLPIVALITLLATSASSSALASQKAKVLRNGAEVHRAARDDSPVIMRLASGKAVEVSSETVLDARGEPWHKIKVTDQFGYILANDVKTEELRKALIGSGIGDEEKAVSAPYSWTFTLRAMGLAGYGDLTTQYGGEGEASFSPLFLSSGYLRRMLGLGVAYVKLKDNHAVVGTLIYRIFAETRGEPELRVRIGKDSLYGATVAGVNFGYRYPFSLSRARYFAAYAEAGSLFTISSASSAQYLWGAGGIGFQF